MASAGTEHFRIGLRRQNGLQQSGPAGAGSALAPEGAADSHSWAQAHQQVKPIWKLEKKHSGTLSAGPGPGLLGVSPQPTYFFWPRALCRSGSAAVIGAAGGGASGGGAGGGGLSNSSLQPLPDLFGSSLLYRRASSRLRPYQQLESFCLHSVPSEKRPFAFPHSSLPCGLTAQKAHSASASTMALPLAPSSPEPYLSLPGAAGENASTKSLAPAVAGKAPLPITPPPAYKPVLNNNAFLRPNSTKVPLLPAPEALKPLVPKIQLVSWHHSGGTGDCAIRPLEQKLPGGDDSLPENLLTPSTPRSQSSPDLGGALAPLTPAREVQLTEAVRKLTVTDVDQGGGGELEQPRFLMPGLLCSALGMSPLWKAPGEGPRPPSPSREVTRAPADRTSDTPVFCTKRISVHLLAARAATAAATSRLSPSLSCGAGPSPPVPPLEEAQTRVLSSPPQLLPDISGVTARLASAHPGQGGSAEPVEGRELDLPAGSAANQVTQVETEDVEEELVDGLEGFCSHDEDEEEEGDSDCSSSSTASQGESLVVISRSCTEILTKSFPSEKVVQPALVYSLFPNVPPTIYFGTRDERVEKLPWEQRKLLRWKMSTVTPNIVKQTVGRSHFKLSKRNDDWLGCWGHHMKSPSFRSIREYQKLNHFPGSFQIGRKDRLWRNLSRMQSRFGRKEFSFFPQSFILPQDAKLLRKAWESNSRQKWIVKPPASARGIGIQVIHKWNQLPKRRPLLVQRYLHKPYLISGSKFDLRIYVYVTCYDPLRIYLFSDGLVRFASCKYSPSMKSLGNKFMHLTNYSVNKKNAEYQTNEDETACQGHKWALKALWNYLSQKGINSDAIWEKIKDVVVKTIISSEPYVTSLLKMYVRRPYSCHELFGFDVMLDENLKPWVLEVNISPSLHSNSPLDVSIKGQMIRDLLNLAGFVLPSTEELLSSSSSGSSSSGLSLPGSRDKCRMSPEQFTAQRLKKAYYLNQKIPDQDFYASVLDVLTPDDVRVLVELEDEFSRRGQFERIFPSRTSSRYLRFFEQPRYFNILTSQWEQKYHGNKLKGVDLLRSWCYKGFHTGAISDSAPVWSLPPSILTSPKADMTYSVFSRSEASRLGKHSSSGGVLPPAERGASPKPRRTEAGLFHLPRRRSPSPAKGSQDSSREPGPVLPDIRFSRQAMHCAGPLAAQPSGDRLLATASP